MGAQSQGVDSTQVADYDLVAYHLLVRLTASTISFDRLAGQTFAAMTSYHVAGKLGRIADVEDPVSVVIFCSA